MLVMLLMFVMLLRMLLLQRTSWLLLAMTDPPIGRTAENRMLVSEAATKLLRLLKVSSGCASSSYGMQSRTFSSELPWSLWGCAIAGSVQVEWILQQIMLWILYIFLDWTSGGWKSKIHVKTTKFICAFISNYVIDVCCITPMLCSIVPTKLLRDPEFPCILRELTMVDGGRSESDESQVEVINQWSIVYSHLPYAIEVCSTNKILHLSRFRSKLPLLNLLSTHQLNIKRTLNMP